MLTNMTTRLRLQFTVSIMISAMSITPVTEAQLPQAMSTSCQLELQKFCSQVAPGPEVLKCLVQNEKDASTECRQEIQRATQILKDAGSRGGGLGAFSAVTGGMGLGPPIPIANYGGSHVFARGASSTTQHRVSISTPVYKDGGDLYGVSLGGSTLRFAEPVVLRDQGTVLPQKFDRADFGVQFSRRLERERTVGARFSLGSATDAPLVSLRDTTFSANVSYGYPGAETSHWILTVFVSNNNPIANYFPIPGFIYLYRTEKFTGMFGIPFASMQWTPIVPWAFSLSIFGPAVNLEATYGPRERVQAFVAYNWGQQSYLRHDRIYDEDRVFLSEMRAFAGLRSPLSVKLSAELQAGHAFAREVYEGPRFSRRDRGATVLDDAWFTQWNLRYIF